MPRHNRTYNLTFQKGINTAVANTKIPDEELEIIENWRLGVEGYDGVLLKRTGYDRRNSNQHAGASKSIQSIYEYINGSTSYLLANNTNVGSSKLEYLTDYSGGSWTNINTSTEERGRLRFATIKDKLYIAGRLVGSTFYSNKYWDGTNYLDMGCPPCNASFTASNVGSGGSLSAGVYQYAITFLYDGYQESGIIGGSIGISFVSDTAVANDSMSLTSIPTGSARVTARKIYRTKAGVTGVFYYLATINDNTTTSYLDTLADTELSETKTMPEFFSLDAPYNSKYITEHKASSVLANIYDQYNASPGFTISDLTKSDTGGSLGSGVYKYKFYKIRLNPPDGVTSLSSKDYALSLADTVTVDMTSYTGTDNSVAINVPSSISSDPFVKGILIERTSVGGSDYKLTYYSGGLTTFYVPVSSFPFTDTTADGSRVTNYVLNEDRPSTATFPNFIAISDAGKPDLFSNIETQEDGTLIPSSNLFSVGEAITGIWSEEDRLIIFTGRAIYELDTRAKSRVFWKTNKLIDGVGSQAGLQCQTPDGYFFIPEFVTNADFRICLFSNNRVTDVGKSIVRYCSNNSIFSFLDIKYYQQLNELWLLAENNGGTSYIFKIKLNTGEWTVDVNGTDLNFNALGTTLTNGIFLGSNDGYIHYQTLNTYQDKIAGSLTSFTTKAKTKHFNQPDGNVEPRRFLATLQTTGSSTSTATVRYANEDGTEYTTTLGIDQDNTTTIPTGAGTHRLRSNSFDSNVTIPKNDIYFQLETTNSRFEVLKDITVELSLEHEASGGK